MSVVEVVTDSSRMRELAGQWNELWEQSPTVGLFQSFDYCIDAWERVARPAGHGLACVTGRRDGRLVAVWPFVIVPERLWTYARPLVASGVELHELLLDGSVDAGAWAQQAWRALLDCGRLDAVDVSFRADSTHAPALAGLPARAVETSETVCVSVPLRHEQDWDSYYTSLSKSYRKDFAKSRRRLEALGTLEFAVLEAGDPRIGALVDWLLEQKRRWAERTGKKGEWLFSEHYRDFLAHQLSRPGTGARNVLMTLTLDGTPLAAQIGALGKDTFEAVIAGFDADYDRFSPGTRLTEAMIRWAWEQGADCELGAGAEPYKLFWSRNQKVTVVSRRLVVTRWGLVALALRRFRRRAKLR